jgi:hypothetical protein
MQVFNEAKQQAAKVCLRGITVLLYTSQVAECRVSNTQEGKIIGISRLDSRGYAQKQDS